MAAKGADPERVRVLNVGKSFLGLGLIARALAQSGFSAAEAMAWLDDAAPATAMWLVVPSATLASAGPEAHLEGLPNDVESAPYGLLRVRLASRYTGGFATVDDAVAAALGQVAIPVRARGLFAGGLAAASVPPTAVAPHVRWEIATLAPQLTHLFGDCLAFAIGPTPPPGEPRA